MSHEVYARVVTKFLATGILGFGDVCVIEFGEDIAQIVKEEQCLLALDAGAHLLDLNLAIVKHFRKELVVFELNFVFVKNLVCYFRHVYQWTRLSTQETEDHQKFDIYIPSLKHW